uniref:Uncharacterized protein n=2 Tax=Vannella robusta TaxID=1487602 RepID=A0A7S4IF33_9EUKA|mmetsp:Transcript_24884/g.31672  ORF Transcript_24884/g.31672 Transcript_24884/m.31672 type:complete len:141 (+) Transcript_24884:253-675(+)|eukprot:CAMPEP_0206199098 /NCGR_PEP_ID=MMETSP0166-20121206/10053_1 /ASSEMBLY_ACC=CAM_ASM_000260 /TAXON_ID=95228 /ORGANISM="Vannella robusta, Strain DIVA3 518/3/11/1/6" /LENGTH=140 /DNA_ID=CAMNT_0053617123 /DNA_START=161 /DNA_END=583 /DNA_ORIENTATION=+
MLDIMDTAGQEEYSALRDSYMKTGEGFVLVYSITTNTSFEAAGKLRTQILRIKEETPDIPVMLVGNKLDLEDERQVTTEQGRALAQKFQSGFIETSAKTDTNIKELFFSLVRLVKTWRENHPEHHKTDKQKKKGGNCTLL